MAKLNCRVCWCDLPAELLAIIAGQTPTDIILFRSVCRSWRSSIPPPFPNKHILSPLFPLTISFHDRKLSPLTLISFHDHKPTTHVTANAVYLVCHRRDASKVRMLSVQESKPGKLRLQHPLCFETTIHGSSGNILDLSEWIVTQITTSYTYSGDPVRQRKVVLVPNSTTPTALCGYRNSLWDFRTETEEGNIVYASQLYPFVHRGRIKDFVSFNGMIYLAEAQGYGYIHKYDIDILVFDYKTWQLFGIVCDNLNAYLIMARPYGVRFVVSDGDLYIVLESSYYTEEDVPFIYHTHQGFPVFYECRVYRLVRDDMNVCKWERVEDLGDRVFFINKHCSFSVSARNLPLPWKGNCVVLGLDNNEYGMEVWQLGAAKNQYLSSSYSDLFSPPGLIKVANK